MREILFRGKRCDNGEWAYSRCPDGTLHSGVVKYDFIPETVGQFTGLCDKNGVRIYEGDIVCLRTGRCHEVKYGDGCFYMDGTGITAKYLDRFTVIGNIHDNPELLKGEDNETD